MFLGLSSDKNEDLEQRFSRTCWVSAGIVTAKRRPLS